MSCSAYYFGHGNDPKIKEIRQKYDVIEERIRKYHEKSQVSNSVNELYGTNRDYFASSLDFSSKRVEKTHKNQDLLVEKQLALLKDEFDIKKKQLAREYEKNLALLDKEFEAESQKIAAAAKSSDISKKTEIAQENTKNQPNIAKSKVIFDSNLENVEKNLKNSNRILQEMKKNLEKDPKEYKSYLRQENLRSKIENLKNALETTKENQRKKAEKTRKNANLHTKHDKNVDDEEQNEEFLRKYRLFKEKYLLKEAAKSQKR